MFIKVDSEDKMTGRVVKVTHVGLDNSNLELGPLARHSVGTAKAGTSGANDDHVRNGRSNEIVAVSLRHGPGDVVFFDRSEVEAALQIIDGLLGLVDPGSSGDGDNGFHGGVGVGARKGLLGGGGRDGKGGVLGHGSGVGSRGKADRSDAGLEKVGHDVSGDSCIIVKRRKTDKG